MRDNRIDIVRGLAMLTIAINHFSYISFFSGYGGPIIPTTTKIGFSSAAEIFVFMSGYMVGMVYLNREGKSQIIFARARKLYIYSLASFLSVIALSVILTESVISATDLSYTLQNMPRSLLEFLMLAQHPFMAGVLQMYVIFLLFTPLALFLLPRHSALFLSASFVLYMSVQFFPSFNLPGGQPTEDMLWDFNLFSWQFLYFLGMYAGSKRLHKPALNWLSATNLRLAAPVAAFLFFAALAIADRAGIVSIPLWDKTNLGPVRLAHFVVHLATFCSAAVIMQAFLPTMIQTAIERIGRNTLECFTFSIPITYVTVSVSAALGHSVPANLALLVATVLLVYLVAYLTESMRFRKAAVSQR